MNAVRQYDFQIPQVFKSPAKLDIAIGNVEDSPMKVKQLANTLSHT